MRSFSIVYRGQFPGISRCVLEASNILSFVLETPASVFLDPDIAHVLI
jgi:hypothetical protein